MKNISEHILTEPLKDFIQRLLAFMPNLLTCLIIFVFGFIAAWIVKYIVLKIANLLRVDRFCAKVGITETFGKVGIKEPPARLLSRIFYWLVVIIFVIIALYTLKIPAIEVLLEKFFLYLPDLFVAALLIIIGYILGNFLGRTALIASVNAGVKFSRLLSKGVKAIVVLLALVMALEQLGIGRGSVIVAFTILFGGFVFALSLSFGLGGKDIARQYLEGKVKGESEQKDDLTHV